MSEGLRVLSLGYTRELLKDPTTAADDSVNRLNFYAENLARYHVLVVTRRREGFSTREQGSMTVTPTNGRNIFHAFWRLYRLGSQILHGEKIDVIQAQEPICTGVVGLLLKWRYKIPLNICSYGANPFDVYWRKESLFNRLTAPLAAFVLRRADGIQVDGKLNAQRLEQGGIPAGRLFYKPMVPSNIEEFMTATVSPLREEWTKHGRFGRLLIFVGRMAKQKNLPFLLKAFQKVSHEYPKARFVLIGDGALLPKMKKMALALGLKDSLVWIKSIPHKELPSLLKAGDMLILGSFYEGFPRVFMEAAAAGLPIVTTHVSGCDEAIIDGETGYIVPQGDSDGFIKHILNLLAHPEKAKAMGHRGQTLIRRQFLDFRSFNNKQVEIWQALKAKNIFHS